MKIKAMTPELRFQESSGIWKQRKLMDNILKIIDFRGRTPKKLGMDWSDKGYLALSALNVKNGYIDFSQDVHYGSRELYDKWMNGNELHQGQVLFTTEAPMGNVAQIPDDNKYILSQRTIAFVVNEKYICEDFLATLLRTPKLFHKLEMLTSGGTAKGISQKSLMEVDVNLPEQLDEQIAISRLLKNYGKRIHFQVEEIKKLQQFRQAMLTKLFPREGAAEPELRFRGFSGKWKLRRLSDFVKEVTRVDASSHAPVMMITAANGFINQSERYSFDNSGQSLQKYILLKQGELAYNHGASKLRPFGSCFVLREKEARVPFVYHCFSVTDNYADFVALELNGNLVERQLRRIVSSGARMDGLLNISFEEYCTVKIALPCQEEQRKIGNFFRNLDTYISLQQKKLERMQRLKAALLEKLFV